MVGRNKKAAGLLLALFAAGAIAMVSYSYIVKELESETYFRKYTIAKSVEVWRDHPLLGVGPGMFGSWITGVTESADVFNKYDFDPLWLAMMTRHRTLDQFWFQLLAETGIVNTFAFVALLLVLWRITLRRSRLSKDVFRGRLLYGLSAAPVIVATYCFGNVLNVTSVLLTYCVLLGLAWGMADETDEKDGFLTKRSGP
jgi:O-antigen ligase